MTIIKSYTDLEQSKKLAEILPLESADMYYILMPDTIYNSFPLTGRKTELAENTDVPCWSLAALLGVLPNPKVYQAIGSYWYCKCWRNAEDLKTNGSTYIGRTRADNPVDACVAMIEELHELNLL